MVIEEKILWEVGIFKLREILFDSPKVGASNVSFKPSWNVFYDLENELE